jgi:hypothetical protein
MFAFLDDVLYSAFVHIYDGVRLLITDLDIRSRRCLRPVPTGKNEALSQRAWKGSFLSTYAEE